MTQDTRVARPDEAAGREQAAGKRAWQILFVVLTGAFMAVLDTTIVNVALPSIAVGTRAPTADLEWVVSAGNPSPGIPDKSVR